MSIDIMIGVFFVGLTTAAYFICRDIDREFKQMNNEEKQIIDSLNLLKSDLTDINNRSKSR